MNSLEQRLEQQVQFWALLGPFLFLASISVLIFKLTLHWYFPITILFGLPLCVKWKTKGMACALSLLFLLFLYSYSSLSINERYWHVGMALALAFSFIILTLSLEEVEGVLTRLQIESKSRLDNFLKLDDSSKKAEESWTKEKVALNSELASLVNDLTIAKQDKEIFHKLTQLAKEELLQIRAQQEQLQQDLVYKKQQVYQLTETLEQSELQLQSILDRDSEQLVTSLQHALKNLEEENREWQKKNEENLIENDRLNSQCKVFIREQSESKTLFSALQQEKEELIQKLETIEKEKEAFCSQAIAKEKELSTMQVTQEQLQKQIDLLKNQQVETLFQQEQLSKEKKELMHQLACTEQTSTSLMQEAQAYQQGVQEYQKDQQNFVATIKEYQCELWQIEKTVEQLQKEHLSLKQYFENSLQTEQATKISLEKVQSQKEELEIRFNEQQHKISFLEKQNQTLTSEIHLHQLSLETKKRS